MAGPFLTLDWGHDSMNRNTRSNATRTALAAALLLSQASVMAVPMVAKQHDNKRSAMPSDFSATYTVDASLKIQSGHVIDRAHPYPNPAPGHRHHHSDEPDPFKFRAVYSYAGDGVGSEATILPGIQKNLTNSTDPYKAGEQYVIDFDVEDNAEFVVDADHLWGGKVSIPSESGGEVTSFSFGMTILGTGGSIGLGWNGGAPPSAQVAIDWCGDTDDPMFCLIYGDGFDMNGGALNIAGWVKTKDPYEDAFGNVNSLAAATLWEDTSIFSSDFSRAFVVSPVYDVVHGSPPDVEFVSEPSTLALMFAVLATCFRVRGREREKPGYSRWVLFRR